MNKIDLAAVGIICIALMETSAIYMGIDGALLSSVVASISAIVFSVVGYEVGKKKAIEERDSSESERVHSTD